MPLASRDFRARARAHELAEVATACLHGLALRHVARLLAVVARADRLFGWRFSRTCRNGAGGAETARLPWGDGPGWYDGRGASPRPGSFEESEVPMDTQTVIATCEMILVVIGIIGLVLVRRE